MIKGSGGHRRGGGGVAPCKRRKALVGGVAAAYRAFRDPPVTTGRAPRRGGGRGTDVRPCCRARVVAGPLGPGAARPGGAVLVPRGRTGERGRVLVLRVRGPR